MLVWLLEKLQIFAVNGSEEVFVGSSLWQNLFFVKLKGALVSLREVFANESPLKLIKFLFFSPINLSSFPRYLIHAQNVVEKLVADPFLENQNCALSLDQ